MCRTIHGVTPNYLSARAVAYLRIRRKQALQQNQPVRQWTESILTQDPFDKFATVHSDNTCAERTASIAVV